MRRFLNGHSAQYHRRLGWMEDLPLYTGKEIPGKPEEPPVMKGIPRHEVPLQRRLLGFEQDIEADADLEVLQEITSSSPALVPSL